VTLEAAHAILRVATERGERAHVFGSAAGQLDWRTSPIAELLFRYAPGEAYELAIDDVRSIAGRMIAREIIDRGRTVHESPIVIPPVGERRATEIVLDREQQAAVDLPPETSLVLDGEAGVGKTLVALYRIAALAPRRPLVLVPTEGLARLVRVIADRLGIARLAIATIDAWLVERGRIAFPDLPKRTSVNQHPQVIALKRHPAVRAILDDDLGRKKPRIRLLYLFGDRDRLQRVLDASEGALPARAIAATMRHTRLQFARTTEAEFRHVDADRKVTLDGRAIDSGTPDEDIETFDVEDVPILFELARRGHLRIAEHPPRYDHIVVDEAQLRAPLELAAIADALAPEGAITLAGDHRQATDETAWFTGWDAARAELARPRWHLTTLAITYRSVPAIAEFARTLAIPTADDPAVIARVHPHALAQALHVGWTLQRLQARDPWRQICVIARTPEHARRLVAELRGIDPELILHGEFRFEPGIIVTTAAAISGLEFDAVVIPDLDPMHYPSTPELARTLYVAATRARDWLYLSTPSTWSPLVKR